MRLIIQNLMLEVRSPRYEVRSPKKENPEDMLSWMVRSSDFGLPTPVFGLPTSVFRLSTKVTSFRKFQSNIQIIFSLLIMPVIVSGSATFRENSGTPGIPPIDIFSLWKIILLSIFFLPVK
jgi:hypothetical protein